MILLLKQRLCIKMTFMILTWFQLYCASVVSEKGRKCFFGYWENSDGIHFQFLSYQSKALSTHQLETKIARANTLPEMDQNLEQRDLGKNTANGIPMRETGGREKSNKCNQCDSTFYRADHLRKHFKTHSGEKPNKCNRCYYASVQAGSLRRHLKMYSGEKSNKCSQCDSASNDVGNLRTHFKIHSGEKPNKCIQCDFASSHAHALRTHMKTHKHTDAANTTLHSLGQGL